MAFFKTNLALFIRFRGNSQDHISKKYLRDNPSVYISLLIPVFFMNHYISVGINFVVNMTKYASCIHCDKFAGKPSQSNLERSVRHKFKGDSLTV